MRDSVAGSPATGTAVEWRNQPEVIDVIGQQSIVGFLEEAGAAAE